METQRSSLVDIARNFALSVFRCLFAAVSAVALSECLSRLPLFEGHDDASRAINGIWLLWTVRARARFEQPRNTNIVSAWAIELARLIIALSVVIVGHAAILRMPAVHSHELLSSWLPTLLPILILLPHGRHRNLGSERPVVVT